MYIVSSNVVLYLLFWLHGDGESLFSLQMWMQQNHSMSIIEANLKDHSTRYTSSPLTCEISCQHHLSTSEETMLNNCLNFTTTIPYLTLIVPTEEVTLKIHTIQAEQLRWKMRQALEKTQLPKSDITREAKWLLK